MATVLVVGCVTLVGAGAVVAAISVLAKVKLLKLGVVLVAVGVVGLVIHYASAPEAAPGWLWPQSKNVVVYANNERIPTSYAQATSELKEAILLDNVATSDSLSMAARDKGPGVYSYALYTGWTTTRECVYYSVDSTTWSLARGAC